MGVQNVKAIFKKEAPAKVVDITKPATVTCQQCGEGMVTDLISEWKMGKVIGAFLLVFLGLIIIISTAGMGFPISLVLFGLALWMGRKAHPQAGVWKCPNCGYYFNRIK